MLNSFVIKMSLDPEKKYYSDLSTLLHGFMMETIDPSYAGKLHIDGIHPYSSCFIPDKEIGCWYVNSLSGEAGEMISNALMDNSLQAVRLKARDESLRILEKSVRGTTYEELINTYYLGNCDRTLNIQFLTPTSFKQNGRYMIYPTVRLIFQSLMQKYDACSDQSSIFSEELVEEFEENAFVTGYRMRSTQYRIERVRIPSFIGEITIRVNGSQQLANVATMLAKFGEYSGVGIKTGMGMGAMKVIDPERNRVRHD